MARAIIGAVLGLALTGGGCTQLNASHCGNQAGDATCELRDATMRFCDRCVAANDGCVAELPSDPACGFGESSTGAEPEASTSTSMSMSSEGGASADGAESSSGGVTEPCGNGVIDEGEACDGRVLPPDTPDCTMLGFGEGIPGCVDDCSTLNYTVCPAYDECGNMAVALGEQCDGINFGAMTSCDEFPNLTGDGLACTEQCTYDTSACMVCRESQQACDPPTDTCCNSGDVCAAVARKCCPMGLAGLCG